MAVTLGMTVERRELSDLESLRVECWLRNEGGEAVQAPGPFDRSGAFRIELAAPGGEPVRTMTRISRQQMLLKGRVDTSADVQELGAGEEWRWKMDLASFHYPLAPGKFALQARLDYAAGGLQLTSDPLELEVHPYPLLGLEAVREHVMIDSVTMLAEAQTAEGTAWYLRKVNYARPLGPWYSTCVLTGEKEGPFQASSAFFEAPDSTLFHQKWLLWTEGGRLAARLYDRGVPAGREIWAALPAGETLIRTALRDGANRLYVFLWAETGELGCYGFDEGGLELLFRHKTRAGGDPLLAIGGDPGGLTLVYPWRGLFYERLSYAGKVMEWNQIDRVRRRPERLVYEAGSRRVKAIYRDAAEGKAIRMVVADFGSDRVHQCSIERLGLRGRLTEFDFDMDRGGRFHLLGATAAGRLYYWGNGRGPIFVAEGEGKFYPVVIAPQQVYLGMARRERGYRFVQYQRRRQGNKFVGMEAHP